MPSVYRSGAFIQQCFAVHPLCLTVKMVTVPDKLGIFCSNCHMRHRLTLATIALLTPEVTVVSPEKPVPIEHCAQHHMDDLRIQEINSEESIVRIRCRPCKVSYHLAISLFETYMP